MEHSEDTYSIKEIANLIDEEQHVIRYWEREFSQLHPQKKYFWQQNLHQK